jgi:hypothetical protein
MSQLGPISKKGQDIKAIILRATLNKGPREQGPMKSSILLVKSVKLVSKHLGAGPIQRQIKL